MDEAFYTKDGPPILYGCSGASCYHDYLGAELSEDDVLKAVKEGRALLVWSHWQDVAELAVFSTMEEASAAYNHIKSVRYQPDQSWTSYTLVEDALHAGQGT